MSRHGPATQCADHRRSRLHRLSSRRVAPRQRLGGLRAGRPLDRLGAKRRAPPRPAGLPPDRRLGAQVVVVDELVHRCDVVFHLAAAVDLSLIVEEPVRTLVTNIQDRDMLQLCDEFRQARVLSWHRRASAAGRQAGAGGAPPRRASASTARRLRASFGVRGVEGPRRVPGSRVPPGARPRLRDRAPVQHRRAAAERAVCGMVIPRFVSAALAGGPARDLRRRHPTRCLLPRAGHELAPLSPGLMDARGVSGGAVQRRLHRAGHDRRPRAAGARADGITVGDRGGPYDEVYGLGIEDMLHRQPAINKVFAQITDQPPV